MDVNTMRRCYWIFDFYGQLKAVFSSKFFGDNVKAGLNFSFQLVLRQAN